MKEHSREAEKEGRGPNKEGCGCGHRDVPAGSKRMGRSRSRTPHSSPNHHTTESGHQILREEGKTEREVGIYSLPTVKGYFTGQNGNFGVCLKGGAMISEWKRKPTLCKIATDWKHTIYWVQTPNVSSHRFKTICNTVCAQRLVK